MMLIKICGITCHEDADAAVRAGADLLGFNFYSGSPRCVEPSRAAAIRERFPAGVRAVGVFVNEPEPRDVLRIVRETGMDMVQLHGDETPEYCAQLAPLPVLKAFRVGADFNSAVIALFPVEAVLLDGFTAGQYGGTGKSADWSRAREAAKLGPCVFLSGGLRAENVRAAIAAVHPHGVDVCSGVEAAPGRKDARLMEAFVAAVRGAPLQAEAQEGG